MPTVGTHAFNSTSLIIPVNKDLNRVQFRKHDTSLVHVIDILLQNSRVQQNLSNNLIPGQFFLGGLLSLFAGIEILLALRLLFNQLAFAVTMLKSRARHTRLAGSIRRLSASFQATTREHSLVAYDIIHFNTNKGLLLNSAKDYVAETLRIYIARLKWLSKLKTIFFYNSAFSLQGWLSEGVNNKVNKKINSYPGREKVKKNGVEFGNAARVVGWLAT
ncbi:uncharacterized protein BDR25DRAFT_362790 [Lindgomyces ingoldianus]|uniref:Uncharacterized protein n=1 Tax=Lindgomyces ingoldianus TaxID=673940 RepID=A0ACB6Q8R8_9PLEO|nr:uncharacterized protein BDR25DRAFT_362790 [Lindgomyces ingoldianus]KAF2463439.1 hypothetical protein BDR25DRAFT_362790 [Lindgomyces ingoldianus]